MSSTFRLRAGAIIVENDAVLLIEYEDKDGIHYNLPGGGVHPNESLVIAVKRELKEEASVEIIINGLAFVYEYLPHLNDNCYGEVASLQFYFSCNLIESSVPRLPDKPDMNQTDVVWIPLSKLEQIVLYPNLRAQILSFSEKRNSIPFIEEQNIHPNT